MDCIQPNAFGHSRRDGGYNGDFNTTLGNYFKYALGHDYYLLGVLLQVGLMICSYPIKEHISFLFLLKYLNELTHCCQSSVKVWTAAQFVFSLHTSIKHIESKCRNMNIINCKRTCKHSQKPVSYYLRYLR